MNSRLAQRQYLIPPLGNRQTHGCAALNCYTCAKFWASFTNDRTGMPEAPLTQTAQTLSTDATAQIAEAQTLAREWQAAFDARQE